MPEKKFGQFSQITIRAEDPDAVFERLKIEFEEIRARCWWEREARNTIHPNGIPRVPEFVDRQLDPDMGWVTIEEKPGAFQIGTGWALGVYFLWGDLIWFSAEHEQRYHVLRYEIAHWFYNHVYPDKDPFSSNSEWGNASHGTPFDPWVRAAQQQIDWFWEGLDGHPYKPRLVLNSPAGPELIQTPLGPAHVFEAVAQAFQPAPLGRPGGLPHKPA